MSAEQVIAKALREHGTPVGLKDVPGDEFDCCAAEAVAALRDAGLLVAPGSASVPVEALRRWMAVSSCPGFNTLSAYEAEQVTDALDVIRARLDSASQDQPSQEAH